MATHSSILAWEIPWTEEPGGLNLWSCKESDRTEKITLFLPGSKEKGFSFSITVDSSSHVSSGATGPVGTSWQ